jgi:tetratricopeptide (TPR) repeat protein
MRCFSLLVPAVLVLAIVPACAPRSTGLARPDTASSPADSKERREAEAWSRATQGLEFDTSSDRVEVRRAPGANAAAALQHRAEGDDLLQQNRVMEALAAYVLAVRHDRDLVPAWIGIGHLMRRKGKPDHAVAAFRTAVDRDPGDVEARYLLATALWAASRQDEAIDRMTELLDVDEDHAGAHERLAVWSYYAGDDTAAWEHLRRAEELGKPVPAQLVPLLKRRAAQAESASDAIP